LVSKVILRQAVIGGVLLATAVGSFALTLGRTRGAALIGQPLEVTIPVRLEAGETLPALCFEADVFYADTQIDAARLQVLTEAAGPQDANIRIRSNVVIDEPVVTVYLKTGCAQKFTRRYVLLSELVTDLPSISAAPITTPAAAGQTSPATAPPLPPRRAAAAGAGSLTGSRGSSAGAPPAGGSTQAKAVPAKPASVIQRKPVADTTKPRLRLDPIELTAERDPTLRASAELLTAPLDNDPKRAEAAALWRAINAQPADVLRDAQRMQDLEKDLKALRDQTMRTQASLGELRTQLQQSEGQRYANSLVYTLIGLLLAALAAAAYFWNRSRKSGLSSSDWWQGDERGTGLGQVAPTKADTTISSPLPATGAAANNVDVDLSVNEAMFDTLKTQAYQAPIHRNTDLSPLDRVDFASSFGGSTRAVNTEELFDIQQQADFFVSLGQYDQAIAVLRNHILESPDTSALAYLDLFNIYHLLERRDDYALLREDFNRVFNAQVPEFDNFTAESRGLETYATAMSRIEVLWPSSKVLEVIEESIFRKPGADGGEAFNPEAYRELMLLHAMAKDIVGPRSDSLDFQFSDPDPEEPSVNLPSDKPRFMETKVQPLSAAEQARAGGVYDAAVPRPSPRLGLDIDLSDSESTIPQHISTASGGPVDAAGDNLIDFDFDASPEGGEPGTEPPKK
jgi:tetratricopeptide (TPR) repeat protein